MKRLSYTFLLAVMVLALTATFMSCKKDEGGSTPGDETLYPVSAIVLNPAGQPQGGAILKVKGAADSDPRKAAVTDTAGRATIHAPAGVQTLVARMGTVFQTEFNVNVAASPSGTNAGTVTLQQSTTLGRVLVIYAGCEQLENVLRSDSVRFYTFDTTTVYQMRQQANTDSTALLNFLKTYSLIFSNCDCGSEDPYALLARIYGRYVDQGGKIYGGHYNWMNLYKIFPGFFLTQSSQSNDSVNIIDANLRTALGFSVVQWTIGGYQRFTDMPTGGASTVYAIITGTSPAVPVIVESRRGQGKYLWTIYHNQDILYYPKLVKIVRYFLYSM